MATFNVSTWRNNRCTYGFNLSIFGNTVLSTGSAIQLAQGYEGKGKGAAGGGAYIAYEIHAQHNGATNSEAVVRLDWNHLIGFEGECKY